MEGKLKKRELALCKFEKTRVKKTNLRKKRLKKTKKKINALNNPKLLPWY